MAAVTSVRTSVTLALLLAVLAGAACGVGVQEATAVRVSGQGCRSDIVGQGVSLGDGLVLASGHVVDGAEQVFVGRNEETLVEVHVAHIDRDLDVAVLVDPVRWLSADDREEANQKLRALAADAERWSTPEAGDEGSVWLRDTEGNLESRPFTVRRRIRANTENVGQTGEVTRPTLELDAEIDQGDSGAVLLAADGSFAGTIWAVSRNRPDIAFAVQGDALRSVLQDAADRPSGPGSC